eukprot:TRINITY_DN12460_c0_g1_i1.p1 TRINITY_DN12460_c0_g1~~TRINITY_DN12460_c0_g1_i1.p1  ORF type:complete len:427 (+),score=87.21 TRINITY_DN12460_c0_g1_i1:190-1470(+)
MCIRDRSRSGSRAHPMVPMRRDVPEFDPGDPSRFTPITEYEGPQQMRSQDSSDDTGSTDSEAEPQTPDRPPKRRSRTQQRRGGHLKTLQQHGAPLWNARGYQLPSGSRDALSDRHGRGGLWDSEEEAEGHRPISCFCTCDAYDTQALYKKCRLKKLAPRIMDDVVHVRLTHPSFRTADRNPDGMPPPSYDVFFFGYGAFVAWGISRYDCAQLVQEVALHEDKSLAEEQYEEFSYNYGAGFKIDLIKDLITLEEVWSDEPDILAKCAVSHALALSLKLAVFEEATTKTIEATKHLPEDLSIDGSIKRSRPDISRVIGELFIQRNSVNLHTDILDVPDWFWENSRIEPLYNSTRRYLDINQRVEVLNKRLDLLKEMMEILRDQLVKQNESKLETYIIIIITIQVLVELVWEVFIQDTLGLYNDRDDWV